MQFAVQFYLVKNLASVSFETTVVIVQLDPGRSANKPVEDTAWQDLVPRVMSLSLPAADHVQPAIKLLQEPRNFLWVIL